MVMSMQTRADGVIIRPYLDADRESVWETIRASYPDEELDTGHFMWWHFGCPDSDKCFMVAEVDSRVVGSQPMELMPFRWGARRLVGGVLTGVVVHPSYRRRGMFSMLIDGCEREAWRRGADFIVTMPNERSCPGFLKLGYTSLGRRDLYVRVLNPSRADRSPGPIMRSVLAVFSAPLAAMAVRGKVGECRLDVSSCIDPAIDDWQHHDRLPGIQRVRSAAWARWRYLGSPTRQYLLATAQLTGGRAAAVAVGAIRPGWVKQGFLMDVMGCDRGAMLDAMAGVLEQMRRVGISMAASVSSSPDFGCLCESIGFVRVPHWLPIKRFHTVMRWNPGRAGEMPAAATCGSAWHLTLGDWDNL
jgi:GNAT superfamily N-acetyltransferase